MYFILKSKKWFKERAHSAYAKVWLIGLTATEAIFFPIPVDPLLVAILLVNSSKWLRYAAITSSASVAGAFVGYFVGLFFFSSVGGPIVAFYGLESQFSYVKDLLNGGVFIFTLVSAIVPIPFKIFVLAAGFTKSNIFLFLLASVLGRTARYFGVAYLTHKFGSQAIGITKRYGVWMTAIGLALISIYIFVHLLQ